jgi:hypothetical protein
MNVSITTPACLYNRAYRFRLEIKKLLHIELSRSFSGYFKQLLNPGGGFASDAAVRRFQK